MSDFNIENWKPFQKNTLQGFFDLILPSGIILRGCMLHQKTDSRWIGLPAKSYTTDSGSTSWTPVVEFATKEAQRKFQDAARAAIDRHLGVRQ